MDTSANGLRVLVTARTSRDAGARVFTCDIDDKALGGLDVLVNNADVRYLV